MHVQIGSVPNLSSLPVYLGIIGNDSVFLAQNSFQLRVGRKIVPNFKAASQILLKVKVIPKSINQSIDLSIYLSTTRILEMWGHFFYLNKMKTKRLSNHMSQYSIHN